MFSDCKFKLIAAWTCESYKCFVDEIKKGWKRKEILLLLAGMPETRSSKSNNCLCFPGEGLTFLEMLESVQCNYLTMSFKNQCEWLEMICIFPIRVIRLFSYKNQKYSNDKWHSEKNLGSQTYFNCSFYLIISTSSMLDIFKRPCKFT